MTALRIQGAGLALMLLALPLLSWSTTGARTAVSVVGLALVAIGSILPAVLRYTSIGGDET